MTVLARFSHSALLILSGITGAALQGCGGAADPKPPWIQDDAPRICPGETRNITASYPPGGGSPFVFITVLEGRNPSSFSIFWNVQASISPANATEAILRDSRDTTQVLLTAT